MSDPIKNESKGLDPSIVTGITPMEKMIISYHKKGMKIRDIAEIVGLSRSWAGVLLKSAKAKTEFLDVIHGNGETWIGEIPGLPCNCVGVLQRRGIFTVSDLLRMQDYKLLRVYNIGPKSIEAIRCYRTGLDMKQAGETNESPDITEEYH